MENNIKLPEYNEPPIIEVAVSVEFTPLTNWTTSSALEYAKFLGAEYPKLELQTILASEIEKFGEEIWQQAPIRLEVFNQNSHRFWYLSEDSNWLIQIQQDRFVLNWRKVTGQEVYPRYAQEVKPRFQREFEKYRNFLIQQNIGELNTTQCELTYVNNIPKGDNWQTVEDATKFIALLTPTKQNKFLPELESISLAGSYLLPNALGRLRFTINHALRDNVEVIFMNLVARGRPQSSSTEAILSWFDIGREWIVRGFTDLTTEQAHQKWGKKI